MPSSISVKGLKVEKYTDKTTAKIVNKVNIKKCPVSSFRVLIKDYMEIMKD